MTSNRMLRYIMDCHVLFMYNANVCRTRLYSGHRILLCFSVARSNRTFSLSCWNITNEIDDAVNK
jgi:hypothetical protein